MIVECPTRPQTQHLVVRWVIGLVSNHLYICTSWDGSPRWSLADKVDTMKDPDPSTDKIQIEIIMKYIMKYQSSHIHHSYKNKKTDTSSQSAAVRRGRPQVGRTDGFSSECRWQAAQLCPCPHPSSWRCSCWPQWPCCARATQDWQVPVGASARWEDMLTVAATFYWLTNWSSR